MKHKVEIIVENPSVSTRTKDQSLPSYCHTGFGHNSCLFFLAESPSLDRDHTLTLCPKIEVLKIRAQQQTAWIRRALMNSAFTNSIHWDVIQGRNLCGQHERNSRNNGQNLPSPRKSGHGYISCLFFLAESLSIDRTPTESPSARWHMPWQ